MGSDLPLSVPQIVSHDVVHERRPSERSKLDQVATAGSLTAEVSVTSVSSDMYRRATAYSSFVSRMSAPTRGGDGLVDSEDADDIGAPLHLAVHSFEPVRRGDLCSVLAGKLM